MKPLSSEDVRTFLESSEDTDTIHDDTCYGSILSRAYRHKYQEDLAIAATWGRIFGKDAFININRLSGWLGNIMNEADSLMKNRYLNKKDAQGNLSSIGF
jgi:hypothetical protein